MKSPFLLILALLAVTVPASAITVTTPANGATVNSPFKLTASTTTCSAKPAVSMGYSIDNGLATIVSTSFNATVSATLGPHILHVKCWGNQVNGEVLLNINVVAASAPTSSITIAMPASGNQLNSPFQLMASATTCSTKPAVSMGYSIDSGQTTIEPTSFQAMVSAPSGAHILHVKCWGSQVSDDRLLNVSIVSTSSNPPPAVASPVFSPAAGQYATKQLVKLSDVTAGSTIHYTTNGAAPTAASALYSGPITVSTSETIEAVAFASGFANSGMATASYAIMPVLSGPSVPSSAISETGMQLLPSWGVRHDTGTSGSSVGSMTLVTSPAITGEAAKLDTTYTNWGGELYSRSYANDPNAMNFVYDAQVWIEAGSQIGNLEMDNNQVIANGDTVVYGFQCSGASNTWEYTWNAGTPKAPIDKWLNSSASCNPADWTPNAWHHIQISYSRDDVGNVTYHSVWLDGVESVINATVPSAFTLGWAPGVLLTNFQVDGVGASGSSTVYLDSLTVYRW
jgi:hypothetical protein